MIETTLPRTVLRAAILYTGGTFGMTDRGAGMEPRAGIDADIASSVVLFEESENLSVEFHYTESERVIDSATADSGTACRIAEWVRSSTGSAPLDGVIVIHGTDTMAYIGARIAFEVRDLAIPVVLTGAQIPFGRPGSDAQSNLHLALDVLALHPAPGTYLAFGSAVHPAVRASKRDCADYAGFTSARKCTPPAAPPVVLPRRTGTIPRLPVGLLTVFPGLHADLLAAAIRQYPGGLVLECYGSGTMPHGDEIIETIRAATRRGTPIVVISQCDRGSVDLERYQPGRALLDAGVIGGGDLTREAALAKLAHLVELGLSGRQLRDWMTTNLLGELSDPTPPFSAPAHKPASNARSL
ncbi:asparaginase domain-containing protein [Nocardia sp. 004]|uniref:asparaginase domain-containing protein n=1 Tax=Nocardia sp. 004 TaxID=3385978 RepID=UPI0039A105E0